MADLLSLDYYLVLLPQINEVGIYRKAIGQGIIEYALNSKTTPELDLLELSEKSFSKFRTQGDEQYLIIGKILRRTAHRLYRLFKRPINYKFLNVVNQ